jgi:hypothetical protein
VPWDGVRRGNDLTNATAIGFQAFTDASNKVRIGNEYVTVVESNAGSWTVSDARFKTNITEEVKGLEFIKLLRPIVYNFNPEKYESFLLQKYPDSIKAKRMKDMRNISSKAAQIRQSGFIAQEVQEAAKKSGYDFNGVHAPENPTDNWSLSYEKLVVPLVKAVQELSSKNDELEKEIAELKTLVQSLGNKNIVTPLSQNHEPAFAALDQNVPNPFNHTTIINYTLPQQKIRAKIMVTDKAGKVLKEINLSGSGKGSVQVDASVLASGAYNYSLYINGRLIDAKQMLVK